MHTFNWENKGVHFFRSWGIMGKYVKYPGGLKGEAV